MIKLRLVLILMTLSCFVFGQSKKDLLEYGDTAYVHENYASAAYFYLKIINKEGLSSSKTYPYEAKSWSPKKKKNPLDSSKTNPNDTNKYKKNSYVVHKLANSYRLNHDYIKAEKWYEIAVNLTNEQFPNVRFWYADALIKNERYDKGIEQLETFKKESSDEQYKSWADKMIVGAYYAQDNSSNNPSSEVVLADSSINFGNSSFGMNTYGEKGSYVFASSGGNNTVTDEKRQNPNFLSDFYLVNQSNDGSFSAASNLGLPINSEMNEGGGVLSIDRTTFYFTRKSNEKGKDVAIYVSKFFNNQWLQPLKLDSKVNLPGYKSMHPALSKDESTLYFSSNRPGGEGGMDIWYCDIDEYGSLSDPVNMGPDINTPGDEVTPYFQYFTKTLFYSSDGKEGIGGLDIYKTTYDDHNEVWSIPKNIGKPFNSSKDDAFYTVSDNQQDGFLSSDRDTCGCGNDYEGSVYCYQIYSFSQPEMKFSIDGVVYNAETNEIIPNALVTFKDIRGEQDPVFITTDENGAYSRKLEAGWELFIKAQKTKFFGDAASVSTLGLTESKHFIQDFFLSPIPLGEIEIPGIEYDFDKATLRPKSKEILDELVEFLEVNDNIVIEIRSHTDSRGNDQYNLNLSEKRAQSVVKYLVEHGINKERLVAVGMGETEPLDDCSKYEECGSTRNEECECHQRNRRTAFKTLSEDFNNVFKGN